MMEGGWKCQAESYRVKRRFIHVVEDVMKVVCVREDDAEDSQMEVDCWLWPPLKVTALMKSCAIPRFQNSDQNVNAPVFCFDLFFFSVQPNRFWLSLEVNPTLKPITNLYVKGGDTWWSKCHQFCHYCRDKLMFLFCLGVRNYIKFRKLKKTLIWFEILKKMSFSQKRWTGSHFFNLWLHVEELFWVPSPPPSPPLFLTQLRNVI